MHIILSLKTCNLVKFYADPSASQSRVISGRTHVKFTLTLLKISTYKLALFRFLTKFRLHFGSISTAWLI